MVFTNDVLTLIAEIIIMFVLALYTYITVLKGY